ncbi:Syntaxin-71 [Capsicum baccatum]|uniref:Syntaxin-71 n=1 Tax=Capsicum baccatum TaxID=33114 RepID=A0A2G2VCJ7_CAPBA|nr:Syntaxin-71 [Capsicum baccatum]
METSCIIDVDEIVYQPPRDGPTSWEIGIPDRTTTEFLFLLEFRQYGLWGRYSEFYPTNDLVYVTRESDYSKDWFFAQVPRKKKDGTYQVTTWQTIFELDSVNQGETYKLCIVIASATLDEIQVDKETSDIKNNNVRLKENINKVWSSSSICIDKLLICILLVLVWLVDGRWHFIGVDIMVIEIMPPRRSDAHGNSSILSEDNIDRTCPAYRL